MAEWLRVKLQETFGRRTTTQLLFASFMRLVLIFTGYAVIMCCRHVFMTIGRRYRHSLQSVASLERVFITVGPMHRI